MNSSMITELKQKAKEVRGGSVGGVTSFRFIPLHHILNLSFRCCCLCDSLTRLLAFNLMSFPCFIFPTAAAAVAAIGSAIAFGWNVHFFLLFNYFNQILYHFNEETLIMLLNNSNSNNNISSSIKKCFMYTRKRKGMGCLLADDGGVMVFI